MAVIKVGIDFRYLSAFVALFAGIIAIAVWVPSGFIRGHFGDIIVVIFIYCFIKTFIRNQLKYLTLYIFVFAVLVEIGQYFDLVRLLGLGRSHLARVAIGTSFDALDILMYFIGCALLKTFEISVNKRGAKGMKSIPLKK